MSRFYFVNSDDYKKEIRSRGKISKKFLKEIDDDEIDIFDASLEWIKDNILEVVYNAFSSHERWEDGDYYSSDIVWDSVTKKAYQLRNVYLDGLYKYIETKYNVQSFSYSAIKIEEIVLEKPKEKKNEKPFYCPCMDTDIGCTCGG